MDSCYSLFSPASDMADEAPLDLIFAQHYLQKLNLVSPQNLGSMSAFIAHQLDVAEEILTESDAYPCAARYLEEIAEARKRLGSSNN